MTATVITHPFLADRIGDAEREVFHLEETYCGLRDGTVTWQEWNEELTCPDRQQVAEEESAQALDEARDLLAALQAQRGGN